jgi:hypothetical protein
MRSPSGYPMQEIQDLASKIVARLDEFKTEWKEFDVKERKQLIKELSAFPFENPHTPAVIEKLAAPFFDKKHKQYFRQFGSKNFASVCDFLMKHNLFTGRPDLTRQVIDRLEQHLNYMPFHKCGQAAWLVAEANQIHKKPLPRALFASYLERAQYMKGFVKSYDLWPIAVVCSRNTFWPHHIMEVILDKIKHLNTQEKIKGDRDYHNFIAGLLWGLRTKVRNDKFDMAIIKQFTELAMKDRENYAFYQATMIAEALAVYKTVDPKYFARPHREFLVLVTSGLNFKVLGAPQTFNICTRMTKHKMKEEWFATIRRRPIKKRVTTRVEYSELERLVHLGNLEEQLKKQNRLKKKRH